MKLNAFIKEIEKIAPLSLMEEWDNSGIQLRCKDSCKKVLVALEINDDVIDEAIMNKCDLILTHHPLIFFPEKSVDINNITGNYICKLIKNDISVYSSHTPFDKCKGGNNDYLAKILGIQGVKSLSGDDTNITRVGKLREEISLIDFVNFAVEKVGYPKEFVRFTGHPDRKIRKIGLCTGAGSDFIDLAVKNKCDLFITGDVKYHEAVNAKANGIAVLDLGHYGTEYLFKDNIISLFEDKKDVPKLIKSKVDGNPFTLF